MESFISAPQGYKFNIFYPELIDKTVAPTYKVEKDPLAEDGASALPLVLLDLPGEDAAMQGERDPVAEDGG